MKKILKAFLPLLVIAGSVGGFIKSFPPANAENNDMNVSTTIPENYPVATFAGGCFWCLESVLIPLDGIVHTRVGYEGGSVETPTYEQVSTGRTGHAETVEIYFDPEKTSYSALTEFFLTEGHDPTELNRQWVDTGPQYRSVIFYHDEEQKQQAEDVIARLTQDKFYDRPIVTDIVPAQIFWPAEEYHQQYYKKYEADNKKPHQRLLLKQQKKKKQKQRNK